MFDSFVVLGRSCGLQAQWHTQRLLGGWRIVLHTV
jgi:hypothetical protein